MQSRSLVQLNIIQYVNDSTSYSAFPSCSPRHNSSDKRNTVCVKPRSNEDASWCMQVGKQEFAWTCMIARSNENKSCMRVDESWPEINQKNAQKLRPFCWACCYKVETAASRSKLVNNSHATLMTGQTSKNSRWLASKFETAQSWCELMRVGGQTQARLATRISSHQLASSFDRGLNLETYDPASFCCFSQISI